MTGIDSMIPDISIVIANWNGEKVVGNCLRALELQSGALVVEIIVVDNASSDGSVQLIREKHPSTVLLCEKHNHGFARANNIGIEKSQGKYICLLNSDVIVEKDCLQKMLAYMKRNPDVGIAGPRILNMDLTIQQSCRRLPRLYDLFLEAFYLKRDTMKSYEGRGAIDVGVLSGCFLFIRRRALNQVGAFDERFYFYSEDVDLCRRYKAAGWSIRYYPGASIIHLGGASTAAYPEVYFIQMVKAKLQYWRKHESRLSVVLYLLTRCLHHLIRLSACSVAYPVECSVDSPLRCKFNSHRAALRFLMKTD